LNGDDRDRTGNLLVANQALSQLSYVPDQGVGQVKPKLVQELAVATLFDELSIIPGTRRVI
jgi:hypothetical protein